MPQLKLAQKGIIIVVIPLLVQGGVYLALKHQLAVSETQAKQAELRREIVSRVNELFIHGFNTFQESVNLSVYGKDKYRHERDENFLKVKAEIGELAIRLERDAHEKETAEALLKSGRGFTKAIEDWSMRIDRSNQAWSLFANIEANEKFKTTTTNFMLLLQQIGIAQQAKLAPEDLRQQELRLNLQRNLDVAMALSILAAIGAGLFFLRGTVSGLAVLKSNASRFAHKEILLPPLTTSDEVGELDKVFHEMVNALTAAQVKEHEMLDQLQQGKDRLDRVIENIPLAVVVTDEKGIIQTSNSTTEKTFLHKPESIHGKPLSVLFSQPGDSNDASTFLNNLIAKGSSSTELEAISADQEVIPAEVSLTRFDSPDGVRYLATIKDISERFRLEQLRREFYAMVSHDIRTPLSSINGVLQLVQRGRYGEVPQEVDEKLSMAEKNVDKILEMVSKLLEIEKLESSNLELSIAATSLQDIITQSITSAAQFAEAHKVSLKSLDTRIQVRADSLYIGNVLTNFISNAVKFSPENSQVTISVNEQAGAQGFAEISVTDHGPGVPVRMQSQIFEKYRQAKPTRDRAKGFGLGLAICKSIVELHGGTIGVESPVSKSDAQQDNAGANASSGSRFWFRLPTANE